MLKKITTLSFIAIVLLSKSALSQDGDAPKNNIKINLLALALHDISLQYERALHKNWSVALQAGFIPSISMPATLASSVPKGISNISLSGFNVTPEVRFYPGKKVEKQAPRGFYLAVDFRYVSYTASANFSYTDSSQKPPASLNSTMSLTYAGYGFGGMLGYQWVINKKVSIDWWFLGAEAGSASITANVTAAGIGANADQLKKQLDNIQASPGITRTSSVSGNTATISFAGYPYAGIRTGLCVGFTF